MYQKLIKRVYSDLKSCLQPGAYVLMYHRIAEPENDLWDLCVSPANFKQHLEVLRAKKNTVSLPVLSKKLFYPVTFKKYYAITFDDGYADNYDAAKPLLEQYNLPATFFICSANIGTENEFWWDELEIIILNAPALPSELEMIIGGSPFIYKACEARQSGIIHHYVRDSHANITNLELYLLIWEKLKPLSAFEQSEIIQELRVWSGNHTHRKTHKSMSEKQVIQLSDSLLFETGVHTVSHPDLSKQAYSVQEEEITDNRKWLERLTGKRINFCSYPFGAFNADTLKIVKKAGIHMAFTTEKARIAGNADRFRAGRLQVLNWDGEEFEKQLWTWEKAHYF